MLDIAIIGGGAAGLATAIFAASERRDLRIAVLDGARNLGAKILISGGGRCNVTNREVVAADFNGGTRRTIDRVLRALPVPETIAFFRQLGVTLHEERWGKLFPDSNRARTVLDALVRDCMEHRIEIRTATRVQHVTRESNDFEIVTSSGIVHARRMVLASGGRSLPRTGSDGHGYAMAQALGHSLVPTTPALVPLVLDDEVHAPLVGVTHDARLVVGAAGAKRCTFDGPLLWTHFGISGPVVLDASRHLLRHRLEHRDASLLLSMLPTERGDVDRWLQSAARARPRALVPTVLAERLPARLASTMATRAGADAVTMAELPRDVRRTLVGVLTHTALPVRDSRGYEYAEVTAGGVSLDGIDPSSMASRVCPGLFIVGEILDVDGRLGGFNFQWAWASARAAGHGLARSFG